MLRSLVTVSAAFALLSVAGSAQQIGAQKKVPARATGAVQIVDKEKPFEVGKPVDMTISLKDIDGNEHSFAKMKGKTIVLDFYSIDCPWSKKAEAQRKMLYKLWKDDPKVAFLMVDANHTELSEGADPYARIREYVKKNEIPFPILIDTDNVIADRFAAQTTPNTFVIDPKGVLRYAGALYDFDAKEGDTSGYYAKNAVSQILAGEEVSVPKTKPRGCGIKRVAKGAMHGRPAGAKRIGS